MTDSLYSEAQIAKLILEFTDPKAREAIELSSLPGLLNGTQYFIDVGANVGQYTYHAAKHLQNAHILAIEANPYLIPILQKRWRICGFPVAGAMNTRCEQGRFQIFLSLSNFTSAGSQP